MAGAFPNVVFKKAFVSAEQSVTSSGLLTIAHGLGVIPALLSQELVCKVTEANWAVNDVVRDIHYIGSASSFNLNLYADATNIYGRFGSTGVACGNKTTGSVVALTAASWRIIVRAYA